MVDEQKKKARIKRQNNTANSTHDRVSVVLPAGTIETIKSRGESVNGLINKLVKEWIECK